MTVQHMCVTSRAAMNTAARHDDEGIGPGIRIADDDFALSKYACGRNDQHIMQNDGSHGNHGLPQLLHRPISFGATGNRCPIFFFTVPLSNHSPTI